MTPSSELLSAEQLKLNYGSATENQLKHLEDSTLHWPKESLSYQKLSLGNLFPSLQKRKGARRWVGMILTTWMVQYSWKLKGPN